MFTKNFFAASLSDQRQVASWLRNLNAALAYDGTGRVKAQIRHIEKKAVECGIYHESEAAQWNF